MTAHAPRQPFGYNSSRMKRALLAVVLCAVSAWAGPKKKPAAKAARPSPASAEVSKALDAVQPAAGACVVDVLGSATAWSAVVKVKLVLDAQGHVVEAQVSSPPNAAAASGCIEKALRSATWPATHAPLVKAEREWTFAMQ